MNTAINRKGFKYLNINGGLKQKTNLCSTDTSTFIIHDIFCKEEFTANNGGTLVSQVCGIPAQMYNFKE